MFPDDFFDSLRPSTPNYTKSNKKIVHPKIITHPLTTKHREIDNNTPIKEEIIEESIVSNYPYTEEKKMRPSLDIDICNEEPSTSGSSNASNNSNRIKSCNQILPICFNSNINPNDFYSIPTFTSPNEHIMENNDDVFKQTPHFINFETEPQEKRKKIMTQRTKSANKIVRQKSSDKICRTPNKKRPSTERSNQKRVTPQSKKNNNKSNKLNLPKILPHTLVEKELTQLMSNVPSKFFEDPEVKKKFNLLMKNIDDIKEVIQKKSNHGYFNAKTGNHNQNINNKDTNCFKSPISRTNKKNVIIQPKKKL